MPKPKKVDDPVHVTVPIRLIPYYAIVSDHPALSGHTAVGSSPEKALTSMKSLLALKFPNHRFVVNVEYSNREVFDRAGIDTVSNTD